MKCGRTFSGMSAFDKHWAKVPMRGGEPCREPGDVGLILHANGTWGQPAPDEPITYGEYLRSKAEQ